MLISLNKFAIDQKLTLYLYRSAENLKNLKPNITDKTYEL